MVQVIVGLVVAIVVVEGEVILVVVVIIVVYQLFNCAQVMLTANS